MKDKSGKIVNHSGLNANIQWWLKEYDYPTITIVGERVVDHISGKTKTVYYFAMQRYAPDGAEHICIDKSLPLNKKIMDEYTKRELAVFDSASGNGISAKKSSPDNRINLN